VYSLDVWETKEDSGRFFTDRMMPALEQLGVGGGPPLSVKEYDLPFVLQG
jgi:hypothetical protein